MEGERKGRRADVAGKRSARPVKTILRPPTTYKYVIGMSGFPSKVPVYPRRMWNLPSVLSSYPQLWNLVGNRHRRFPAARAPHPTTVTSHVVLPRHRPYHLKISWRRRGRPRADHRSYTRHRGRHDGTYRNRTVSRIYK